MKVHIITLRYKIMDITSFLFLEEVVLIDKNRWMHRFIRRLILIDHWLGSPDWSLSFGALAFDLSCPSFKHNLSFSSATTTILIFIFYPPPSSKRAPERRQFGASGTVEHRCRIIVMTMIMMISASPWPIAIAGRMASCPNLNALRASL